MKTKQYFWLLAIVFSLGIIMTSCEKGENEPSITASGNVNIGNDSFEVKYAYWFEDEPDVIIYWFYDKDVLKYYKEGKYIGDIDIDYSSIQLFYSLKKSEVYLVNIDYNINEYRGTGCWMNYDNNKIDIRNYVTLTRSNDKVIVSGKSIPMIRWDFETKAETDVMVSFSAEGNPVDFTDYYAPKKIQIKKVTDQKEITFLKSLSRKHRR